MLAGWGGKGWGISCFSFFLVGWEEGDEEKESELGSLSLRYRYQLEVEGERWNRLYVDFW